MRDRTWAIEKAKELVSKLTLEEKAAQMKFDAPSIDRLNIPKYNWWNEGLHGLARAGVATSFPQAIALAATFNTKLIKNIADKIAIETRAKYNASSALGDRDIYKGLTLWSPNVNIFRDPRWGRGHETFGEDPFLTASLGCAFVDGLQGNGKYLKSAACAKHFAVHSGPESLRHQFNAISSEEDLENTYLVAFKALVEKSHVEGVMGAYNRTNGEPCCASEYLQNILRNIWKFEGYFVSDCWAIKDFHENHKVTSSPIESVSLAIKNDCDLNCGCAYKYILDAVRQGLVSEEDIDDCVIRLFTTRYLLGLNEETEFDKISYEVIESEEHVNLAIQAAQESLVLLKNDGILPLDKNNLNAIAVIGPNANSRRALIGNYHGTSSRYITVLEGIQNELDNEDIKVRYSVGCHLYKEKVETLAQTKDRFSEAITIAKMSDLSIICVGLDETLEGEEGDTGNSYASGDKKDLKLPGLQNELIEEISKIGKPFIVMLLAGSSIDLSFCEKYANAILLGWYPGARGGKAIAETLFGKSQPSGKLPITFYKNLEGMGDFTDYSMKGRTYRYADSENILYSFGYGLSYNNLEILKSSIYFEDDQLKVTSLILNKSNIQVKDVLQIYLIDKNSNEKYHLCGFDKIEINKNSTKDFTIEIDIKDNPINKANLKNYLFSVGFSQPDIVSEKLLNRKCEILKL
jgi:beta-glucosidase